MYKRCMNKSLHILFLFVGFIMHRLELKSVQQFTTTLVVLIWKRLEPFNTEVDGIITLL